MPRSIARDGTVRHITKRGVRIRVARIGTPSSLTGRTGLTPIAHNVGTEGGVATTLFATAPVAQGVSAALPPGACGILNLVLGPLDLDLLGLQVHLDRVVLTIIAQSGPGNLLGNLLCAVAGLLDADQLGALLGRLANLLNDILAIINS